MSRKKAVDAAEAEKRKRALACQAEIEAACKKHNCQVVAEVTIRGNQVRPQVLVLALDAG